jgi:hypothetical protein
MSFQEKTLHCADCGTDFSFTAEEQEFYQSRGYTNEPKRCPSCKQARKTERHGGRGNSYGLPRQTFRAKCGARERDTEVPLAFTSGKLAYYSDYFRTVRLIS